MLVPPGSPLLHCLQQLNDDVWAQVLLPKLIANKSAHAVALTCTQLRSLCQRSHQQLDLTGLASEGTDTVSVKAYTETLAQHFPSCNAVKLLLSHSHGYVVTPCILEALSRQVHAERAHMCSTAEALSRAFQRPILPECSVYGVLLWEVHVYK